MRDCRLFDDGGAAGDRGGSRADANDHERRADGVDEGRGLDLQDGCRGVALDAQAPLWDSG